MLEMDGDFRTVERLMQIYAYFASAYIFAEGDPSKAGHRLPMNIAVPLVKLSRMVCRPPILSYAGYVLNNWRRVSPTGPIALANLATIQHFRAGRDEDWFILVHVDIEARAAGALIGIQHAVEAAHQHDAAAIEAALTAVHDSLEQMIATFQRMPEHCDAEVYHWKVRPYIFSFNEVSSEGVDEFGGKPQSLRGQTGAQSSVIPILVAGLGLRHEQNSLTQHLDIMREYMPHPHRELIAKFRSEPSPLRRYVTNGTQSAVREAYNACLRRVLAFRRLHYHFASTYIAQKVANPVGTGGTLFMDWLAQLANETEAQLV
jgi:indoleamine 2,3-dioxygenase